MNELRAYAMSAIHGFTEALVSWRGAAGVRTIRNAHAASKIDPPQLRATIKRPDYLHFAFTSQSQVAVQTRSLLRAILRECTYLPDPNARLYAKRYALERFKTYAVKVWQHRDEPEFGTRLAAQFRDATKNLARLRKANEGDRKALLKILHQTYGRVGKRRHSLMQPLKLTPGREEIQEHIDRESEKYQTRDVTAKGDLNSETGQTGETVELLEKMPKTKPDGRHVMLTPELYALLKSQRRVEPPEHTRNNPREIQPQIPKLNAANRPMPQKRVQNLTHKWYATVLDRIHPPIPTQEWEQLRDWASGRNIPKVVIPRRKNAVPNPSMHFGQENPLQLLVVQGRVDKKIFGNPEAHHITPRFMVRIWQTVFSQCPTMLYNEEKKKWDVKWGANSYDLAFKPGPKASPRDVDLNSQDKSSRTSPAAG
jgi:hypothetical protein